MICLKGEQKRTPGKERKGKERKKGLQGKKTKAQPREVVNRCQVISKPSEYFLLEELLSSQSFEKSNSTKTMVQVGWVW